MLRLLSLSTLLSSLSLFAQQSDALLDPGEPLSSRIQQVSRLSGPISPADLQAYTLYLNLPPAEDVPENHAEWTFRNDLSLRLLALDVDRHHLTRLYLRIWNNPDHYDLWRDYIVQHMGDLLPLTEGKDREELLETLWGITRDPKSTFAGTALIALSELQPLPAEEQKRFLDTCKAWLQQPGALEASRSTALQFLHEFNPPDALTEARKLLENERSILLRLSALYILGEQGTPEDHAFLDRYQNNPIPLLSSTAQKSQQRIRSRLKF